MAEAEPAKKGKPVHGVRGPSPTSLKKGSASSRATRWGATPILRALSARACVRCRRGPRRSDVTLPRQAAQARAAGFEILEPGDIGDPDECWNWKGYINPSSKSPQFGWKRDRIATTTQHHPQRIAMWLSWGDLGLVGVKTTCGNRYCCNPFHIIPQKVGVFVDHDSYIDSFETQAELMTLKQQVHDYIYEQAIKEQAKLNEENSRTSKSGWP